MHPASVPQAATGQPLAFVYCHPFGEEKMHAHRVATNFSRYAAERGATVFRFDYFGCGDSEGMSEEVTLRGMVEDIVDAVGFVREQCGSCRVILLGLRLGATLAIEAGAASAGVNKVIAWEPVFPLHDYFYQLLRMNLSWQMTVFKEIQQDRDELVRLMAEGEVINVEGFAWHPGLFAEAKQRDESGLVAGEGVPVLLASIGSGPIDVSKVRTPEGNPAGAVEQLVIKDSQFWKPLRKVYSPYAELFESSLSWGRTSGRGE